MSILDVFKDVKRKKNVKARDFAQELSYQFLQSPMCSDYENLFAQIRPLVDAMKMVKKYVRLSYPKKVANSFQQTIRKSNFVLWHI